MTAAAAALPALGGDTALLKARLRRVERVRKLKAVALVAPLLAFILFTFLVPIGLMLFRAVHDPELRELLPQTAQALAQWDERDVPGEELFALLMADVGEAQRNKQAGNIGKRLNYEIPGARSAVMGLARAAKGMEPPYKDAVIAKAPIWGERETWSILKRATQPYTLYYLLNSLDYRLDVDGAIEPAPQEEAIYQDVFVRTLGIALAVTLITLVLGYPVAFFLATQPPRIANLLLILVLLPFWTSLLVRTTAWFVLLQTQGPINDALLYTGIVSERVQLIFTRFGTIAAMAHIQLPFTLLPIYSVMKGISPSHMRAARSLGAGSFYAFWRVYMPQTLPGVAAGCLLTFILCLGYYITPALVGGPTDQLVSTYVAQFTNQYSNWGMASALGAILLAVTLVLYFLYNRLVGIDRMKLG